MRCVLEHMLCVTLGCLKLAESESELSVYFSSLVFLLSVSGEGTSPFINEEDGLSTQYSQSCTDGCVFLAFT